MAEGYDRDRECTPSPEPTAMDDSFVTVEDTAWSRRGSSDPPRSHIYSVRQAQRRQSRKRMTPTSYRTTTTSAVAVDQIPADEEVIWSDSQSENDDGTAPMHAALDFVGEILLRGDHCSLNVALEGLRYMLVVIHAEGQAVIIGMEWTAGSGFQIGTVIPVIRKSTLKLDGDGGFHFTPFATKSRTFGFKPASVRSLWSAVQALLKILESAGEDTETWSWLKHYEKMIRDPTSALSRWSSPYEEKPSELELIRRTQSQQEANPASLDEQDAVFREAVTSKLKEILFVSDLDTVTSKQLRLQLEEHFGRSLKGLKSFIDEKMITLMGQMDSASKIFDYLFLGTEWNASNREELQANNCRYVLNVTKEIANFYPDHVKYYNVRLWDTPSAELMPYWEDTFRFIREARRNKSSVLVHCKMGVSRSASTVIAYAMKQYHWTLEEAFKYVKGKRSIIKPNEGFKQQLIVYEGILRAKRQSGSWSRRLREERAASLSALPATSRQSSRDRDHEPRSQGSSPPDSPTPDSPPPPQRRYTHEANIQVPEWTRWRSTSPRSGLSSYSEESQSSSDESPTSPSWPRNQLLPKNTFGLLRTTDQQPNPASSTGTKPSLADKEAAPTSSGVAEAKAVATNTAATKAALAAAAESAGKTGAAAAAAAAAINGGSCAQPPATSSTISSSSSNSITKPLPKPAATASANKAASTSASGGSSPTEKSGAVAGGAEVQRQQASTSKSPSPSASLQGAAVTAAQAAAAKVAAAQQSSNTSSNKPATASAVATAAQSLSRTASISSTTSPSSSRSSSFSSSSGKKGGVALSKPLPIPNGRTKRLASTSSSSEQSAANNGAASQDGGVARLSISLPNSEEITEVPSISARVDAGGFGEVCLRPNRTSIRAKRSGTKSYPEPTSSMSGRPDSPLKEEIESPSPSTSTTTSLVSTLEARIARLESRLAGFETSTCHGCAVSDWSPERVELWAQSVPEIARFASHLSQNELTGLDLHDLCNDDLISIGIFRLPDRKAILRAARGLCPASFA